MITKMLERLKEQRSHIDFMIEFLENEIKNSNHYEKRKSIIKSVKRHKLHWTQRPENKMKLKKHLKKMRLARKAKYNE